MVMDPDLSLSKAENEKRRAAKKDWCAGIGGSVIYWIVEWDANTGPYAVNLPPFQTEQEAIDAAANYFLRGCRVVPFSRVDLVTKNKQHPLPGSIPKEDASA